MTKILDLQMTKFLLIVAVLCSTLLTAQNHTVVYSPTTENFANPERGFYKYSDTHSANYELLNQTSLINHRTNEKMTLIFRYFYLEDFKNSPISAAYLANMQTDFDRLRNAGMKAVIRFAYSEDNNVSQRDASKARILAQILQLKPLLILNADVIAAMQAGFIGTWGEWYFTSQPEFGGNGYNGTSTTQVNENNRKEVLDAILSALPSNRMIQVRKPAFKRDLYNTTTALTSTTAYTGTALARIGHHNDCFLASADDYGTYDTPSELPYLEQDSKFLPIGGETCGVNIPRSSCASAVTEMARFHWSYLNSDYDLDVLANFESGNCMDEITNKLGYRFQLNSAVLPTNVSIGNQLPVTIKVSNKGFAAPFNERKVYLVLKNTSNNQIFKIQMTSDPRRWVGTAEIVVSENLSLPANIPAGNYAMYLSLPDNAPSLSTRPEYAIRLANSGVWDSATGYNNLNSTVTISAQLGLAENGSKLNVSIYPVPSNDVLNIDLAGISDYKISMYTMIGQQVNMDSASLANKMTINTSSLSDGIYVVEFVNETFRETRKIIVKH